VCLSGKEEENSLLTMIKNQWLRDHLQMTSIMSFVLGDGKVHDFTSTVPADYQKPKKLLCYIINERLLTSLTNHLLV